MKQSKRILNPHKRMKSSPTTLIIITTTFLKNLKSTFIHLSTFIKISKEHFVLLFFFFISFHFNHQKFQSSIDYKHTQKIIIKYETTQIRAYGSHFTHNTNHILNEF